MMTLFTLIIQTRGHHDDPVQPNLTHKRALQFTVSEELSRECLISPIYRLSSSAVTFSSVCVCYCVCVCVCVRCVGGWVGGWVCVCVGYLKF